MSVHMEIFSIVLRKYDKWNDQWSNKMICAFSVFTKLTKTSILIVTDGQVLKHITYLYKLDVKIIFHLLLINMQSGVRKRPFNIIFFFTGVKKKLELDLMFMKHYAPNRCLYIKVAKLRTGVGSAKTSYL